jgi:hypothetical protein
MEEALSRADGERLGSQSPLLTTSYRLKLSNKDGLQNELNFGDWFRHYDMQRESGRTLIQILSVPLPPCMCKEQYTRKED